MSRYNILLNILDSIRSEAPEEFKSYYPDPSDKNGLISARSKAFIHLYLKVKCGITNFKERHALITEGSQDGGVDAYFLDTEAKTLLLIQSKFRDNEENFEEKTITADELVNMEVVNVLRGETKDSKGVEFNEKIKEFQKKWREISDHANYIPKVIILANIKKYSDEQIKRLIDNSVYEIFDFNKTYDDLIFPLCSGTYYEPGQISITINLGEKEPPILKQKISTKYGEYRVAVIFVPAKEIARILHKYKNSILRYNPRNYLSLSHNKVNKNIRDSITLLKTNDFAVLNNGITIICDSFEMSALTGKVDIGQIIIQNPQIINGGQTAYTLSKIYEVGGDASDVFKDKEVLLKAIITGKAQEHNITFIEEVSNATNQQSKVEEADRRSNELIQKELQDAIYTHYGYFYEKKKGEFYNGLDSKYIEKDLVIDRDGFLRAYLAFQGQPRWARQKGGDSLFAQESFHNIFKNAHDFHKMVFSYFILRKLAEIEREGEYKEWGFGLRYGKMAIISAIAISGSFENISKDSLDDLITKNIDKVHNKWKDFEAWARDKKENKDYLVKKDFDYDNYYKGKTINSDVQEFFKK